MYITGWIAITSSPSGSTTTTRFLISPMRRMPTLGWVMIAPPNRLPLRPGLRDRERLAREVVGRDLAVARLDRHVVDRARDAAHPELVGALDHRHDQAVGRVDRDADVDRPRGTRRRRRARARSSRGSRAARARSRQPTNASMVRSTPSFLSRSLFASRSFAVLWRSHSATVTTCGDGQLRVDHVVGGDAPPARERDDLVAWTRHVRRNAERARATRARCSRRARRDWCAHGYDGDGRSRTRFLTRLRAGRAHHVVVRHAPALAGTRDLLQVDTLLAGELAHRGRRRRRRRGTAVAVARARLDRRRRWGRCRWGAARTRGGCRLRRRRGLRRCRGRGARGRVDLAQRCADRDHVAFVHQDFGDHPGFG